MIRIENLPQEADDASFDWFQTIDLVPLVQRFVPDTNAKMCMLGCGNSLLSANLCDKSYHSIINLDYWPILIDKMENMNSATRPEMTWQTAESFDVCIDKDTMDAMMTSIKDPWNRVAQE